MFTMRKDLRDASGCEITSNMCTTLKSIMDQHTANYLTFQNIFGDLIVGSANHSYVVDGFTVNLSEPEVANME